MKLSLSVRRISPGGFPSSNGFSGGGNGSAFTSLQQQQQQQQQQHRGGGGGINGFESAMSGGGVFEGNHRGGGGVNFDRSMSTANGFGGGNDVFGRGGGGGYDRQMSAPNLRDQFGMGGGGGFRNLSSPVNDHRGDYGGGSRGGGFFVGEGRGRNNSPPMYGKNDAGGMQIGTWNAVPTSSNSGGGYGSGGGGGGGSGMNFEIGTFNMGDGSGGGGSNNYGGSSSAYQSQSGHNIQGGPGIRETGIIEKLLVSHCGLSYFLQAVLFFKCLLILSFQPKFPANAPKRRFRRLCFTASFTG